MISAATRQAAGTVASMGYALWATASVPLLARVRGEYRHDVEFSEMTVWAVWIFYGLLVALVVVAAAAGAWELGLPSALSLVLGVPLLVLGVAIDLAGILSMGSLAPMNGTQPDRLITGGAFRDSRNPHDLGIGLAGIERRCSRILASRWCWPSLESSSSGSTSASRTSTSSEPLATGTPTTRGALPASPRSVPGKAGTGR